MKTYETLYVYGKYLLYVLYLLTVLGIWSQAPQYLNSLEYFLQIFIGVLLIVLNNPITKHKYSPIDKKLAFSAGFFLLASTTLNTFLRRLSNPFKEVKNDEDCGCN